MSDNLPKFRLVSAPLEVPDHLGIALLAMLANEDKVSLEDTFVGPLKNVSTSIDNLRTCGSNY